MSASSITAFKDLSEKNKIDPLKDVLPHGSYLINLGNPDEAKRTQSANAFIDDLERCEQLGIGLYNLHPGSTLGEDKSQCLKYIADGVNAGISKTKFVKVVLENMAGAGNVVGGDLQDLATIIEHVEDKSRVGVCIDTCHTFAAGYDLRDKASFDKFWAEFDSIIGYKYLSAIHLNDSKAPLGSNRDLHQNIGLGFLGLECFRLIMNKPELQDLPIVLETPNDDKAEVDIYGVEIKLLEWLHGKEADDKEVLAKAEELSKQGAKERQEHQAKHDKKTDSKPPAKRQKSMLDFAKKK